MTDHDYDQLLYYFRPPCPYCAQGVPRYEVSVHSAKQRDSSSWEVQGSGKLRTSCPQCGMMFEVTRQAIPIECSNYRCPSCGRETNQEYDIQRVDASGNEFEFEAVIRCKSCRHKRKWVRYVKSFFSIKKISISVSGLTIERFESHQT